MEKGEPSYTLGGNGFEGVGGGRLGEPGGGYYRGHGLHGALGVVQKQ